MKTFINIDKNDGGSAVYLSPTPPLNLYTVYTFTM